MKKYLIIIYCCIHSLTSFSQQAELKGIVKDALSMDAVEFATVVLMKSDSTFIAGSLTDSLGCFVLPNTVKIDYLFLKISYVGYKTKYVSLSSFSPAPILLENDNTLKEVVVTGKRPFFQQEIDKYVINVSDNLVTAGRNTMDVLRNTPGVFVQNKSISLIGGGAEVWIDGRPSRMSGEQLASFLDGMQAENIDKIEVITNPSSKFDAGGSGGIINIKLKKGRIDTFNGTANIGYQLSKRDIGMAGISLNYRKNKVNIYGNYNFRGGNDVAIMDETTTNTIASELQSYDKHVNKDTYHLASNNYRVGVDMSPNESNIFGVMFNGYDSDSRSNILSKTTIIPPIDHTSFSEMNGKYKNKNTGQMYNANYKHIFGKEGQEISTDLDYAYFSSRQSQNQLYSFSAADNTQVKPQASERSYLPQKNNIWSARLDYKQPWFKDAFFETGIKYGQTKTDNDILYEELVGSSWQNDKTRSNYFKYQERVFAAYYSFRHKFGNWSYQLGLRTEYTDQKGNQVTTNDENKNSYWDLFPTAFLLYEPSQDHNFIISYNRRFNRPDFSDLNPFEIALDKYSFIRGNPHLNPSYGNNISLKYIYSRKLSTTLNIADLKDRIFQQPIVETETGRYGYTWGNFGRRTAYVFEMSYNNVFFKRWRMNTMGQLAYIKQDAGKAVTNFDNNGLMGFFMLNNNFEITNSLSVELNYWYRRLDRSCNYL